VPALPGALGSLDLVPPRRADPALGQPRHQVRGGPLRPRLRAALAHRDVVDVGDRPLLLGGAGEHGGQELRSGRRPVPVGTEVVAGRGSRADRVERGHVSTVTPSARSAQVYEQSLCRPADGTQRPLRGTTSELTYTARVPARANPARSGSHLRRPGSTDALGGR
jgi:hypothetical protein